MKWTSMPFQRRKACWIVILQHIHEFLIHLWHAGKTPRLLWRVRKRVVVDVVAAAHLDSDCSERMATKKKGTYVKGTIKFWFIIHFDIWNLGVWQSRWKPQEMDCVFITDWIKLSGTGSHYQWQIGSNWKFGFSKSKVFVFVHEILNQYFLKQFRLKKLLQRYCKRKTVFLLRLFSLARRGDCKAADTLERKANKVSFLLSTNHQFYFNWKYLGWVLLWTASPRKGSDCLEPSELWINDEMQMKWAGCFR